VDCPVDREPMMAVEYEDIEIDCCPACEGIWLDAGELELLFGDDQACRRFLAGGNPAAGRVEKTRRCPICRARMEKRATASDAPVTYDRCPRGHGIWLDGGELQTILKEGVSDADGGRVAAFLRELFPGEEGESAS